MIGTSIAQNTRLQNSGNFPLQKELENRYVEDTAKVYESVFGAFSTEYSMWGLVWGWIVLLLLPIIRKIRFG